MREKKGEKKLKQGSKDEMKGGKKEEGRKKGIKE